MLKLNENSNGRITGISVAVGCDGLLERRKATHAGTNKLTQSEFFKLCTWVLSLPSPVQGPLQNLADGAAKVFGRPISKTSIRSAIETTGAKYESNRPNYGGKRTTSNDKAVALARVFVRVVAELESQFGTALIDEHDREMLKTMAARRGLHEPVPESQDGLFSDL